MTTATSSDEFERILEEVLDDKAQPAVTTIKKNKKKPAGVAGPPKKKNKKNTTTASLTVFTNVDDAISGNKEHATTMGSLDEAISKFVDKQADDVVRYELIATKPSAGVVLLRALSPPGAKTLKHLAKLTGASAELKVNKERKNDDDFIAIVKSKLEPKKKIEKTKKKKTDGARDKLKANMQKLKKKTSAAATVVAVN
jgi:hypothetical protein